MSTDTPAQQCQSTQPHASRPDAHCPNMMCGVWGNCVLKPHPSAAAPQPAQEPKQYPVAEVHTIGDLGGTVNWMVHTGAPLSIGDKLYAAPTQAAPAPAVAELVEALRKDAERYRWLRFADLDAAKEKFWPDGQVPEGLEFDAAVDAAMNDSALARYQGGGK